MTTIYLIRHAEAEGNLYRRVHGWYDSLITDNGYRQIAALEKRFRGISIDAVYSSDLFRTRTTARAVYVPKGLELHTDPGLRELKLGDWEDMTFGFVRHRFPQAMELFNRTDPAWEVPGGESFFQLGERVEETVRRIARRHSGQTAALFSHGMAIRQFLGRVKNIPPEQWHSMPHGDNTAVSCLTWDGERFAIEFEMDNSHLSEDISTLARQAWWRKGGKAQDVNLWYAPLNQERDWTIYLEARRESWALAYGAGVPFDREEALQNAGDNLSRTPWGVTLAFAGDQLAGVLELDPSRYAREKAGCIPFCWVAPQRRGQGLGIQLIGQAVAFYRPIGRNRLRLHCPAGNEAARRFFQKYGFTNVSGADSAGLLEKYIGYDQ